LLFWILTLDYISQIWENLDFELDPIISFNFFQETKIILDKLNSFFFLVIISGYNNAYFFFKRKRYSVSFKFYETSESSIKNFIHFALSFLKNVWSFDSLIDFCVSIVTYFLSFKVFSKYFSSIFIKIDQQITWSH